MLLHMPRVKVTKAGIGVDQTIDIEQTARRSGYCSLSIGCAILEVRNLVRGNAI